MLRWRALIQRNPNGIRVSSSFGRVRCWHSNGSQASPPRSGGWGAGSFAQVEHSEYSEEREPFYREPPQPPPPPPPSRGGRRDDLVKKKKDWSLPAHTSRVAPKHATERRPSANKTTPLPRLTRKHPVRPSSDRRQEGDHGSWAFRKVEAHPVGESNTLFALDKPRILERRRGSTLGSDGHHGNAAATHRPSASSPFSRPSGDQIGASDELRSSNAFEALDKAAKGSEMAFLGQSGGRADVWGSLTRKPKPERKSSAEFWRALDNSLGEAKAKETSTKGASDWGRDWDIQPKQDRRAQRPRRSQRSLDDWSLRTAPKDRNGISVDIESQFDSASVGDWQIQPAAPPSATFGNIDDRPWHHKREHDHGDRKEKWEGEDSNKHSSKRRTKKSSRFEEEDEGMDDSYEEYLERRRQRAERKAKREAERGPKPIRLPELITISDLASALKVENKVFLSQLGELGFEGVSLDSIMAGETAALVAQEYGFEPTVESGDAQDLKPRPPAQDPSSLPPRPPVVTIMGHVDHGKTTLLDYLRKSSIAAQEHGGITQHIGAFSVRLSGKHITFLDTPGHAAFLTMRQRGANVTDIVILVVAADDSVKPQTLEAIKHARTAKVPIIVAISKIDKDGVDINRVKADLAENGVDIEDYGGDVQTVCISGKTGQGMDDLAENILTLSEILDVRAERDGPAEGWILESSLKPVGRSATILVNRGTLRTGDFIAAGTTWAKVRQMRNEAGVDVEEAPPGTAVEILGWRELPAAGDQVLQGEDEGSVKSAVSYREGLREREKDAAAYEKISEQRRQLSEQRAQERAEEGRHKRDDGTWGTIEQMPDTENGTKMVNFVVKGDVHGSVEAVCAAMQEIGSHEVRARILRSAAGHIIESDIEHAAVSKSIIVNFNLPISGVIKALAEEKGVRILDHTIIYHLVDDVKAKLSEQLAPEITFKVLGEAEVLQVFPIHIRGKKYKNIAGCRIRNGRVEKGDLFRVFRGGEMLFEGTLESLKQVKKDINEARKGNECGIGFAEFQDFEVGDQIQAVKEVRTERKL